MKPSRDPSQEEIASAEQVLRKLAESPEWAEEHPRLKGLLVKAYKRGRKELRRRESRRVKATTRNSLEATGRCQSEPIIARSPLSRPIELAEAKSARLAQVKKCYICKGPYSNLDSYYHMLCPDCATLNRARRLVQADMTGRTALVTGGRIKIGYHIVLSLLRAGATVVATTRFPNDAVARYQELEDFPTWRHRLHIVRLDLLDLPNLVKSAHDLERSGGFDVIINNAAQTVRRPQEYYQELLARERIEGLPGAHPFTPPTHVLKQSERVQGFESRLFPKGLFAPDGQPLDLRDHNSWLMEFPDVPLHEMLEAHVINTFAPFILIQSLLPGMKRSTQTPRFIVNVSAMEGCFSRRNMTTRHVHTNMAKASLNMVTRTCAEKFAEWDIYMNSVDTGWITQENPFPVRSRLREEGFVPPLDEVDGASRVLAPVYDGINDEPIYGLFLKDYAPISW